MKLVYIAGPYRAATRSAIDLNIARARGRALDLVEQSFTELRSEWYPVVPHTNTEHFDAALPQVADQYYLDGTLAMLKKCDAVLLTHATAADESSGTKNEVNWALAKGIPVFKTMNEFFHYARQSELQSRQN